MSVEKKVLIVDDKTPLAEMLNEQLLLLDEFIPNVATCGEEALKKSTAEFAIELIKGVCHLTWEH